MFASQGDLLKAYNTATLAYSAQRETFDGTIHTAELLAGATTRCIALATDLRFSVEIPIAWTREVLSILAVKSAGAYIARLAVTAAGAEALQAYRRRRQLHPAGSRLLSSLKIDEKELQAKVKESA